FDTTYTINNALNKYAKLPLTDTTIYSTTQGPIQRHTNTFYYASKLTTATMAGTYATTVTYTAVGAEIAPVPLRFKQISVGSSHACAIASDNNAYCWGSGYWGQLGDGTYTHSVATPVSVAKLAGGLEGLTAKQISVGRYHTCVVASDDNAYCWGSGANGSNHGQLGNGASLNSNIPVPVAKLAGGLEGLTVKQVSAGDTSTCAIASDDNVYCWGYGTYGQLGNGSNSTSDVPVPVAKIAGGLEGLSIKQISTGGEDTCAIASDGNLYCWGSGWYGKRGNGSSSTSNIPVSVSKLSGGLAGLTIKQVSVGNEHICAITSDNNAYCWGGEGTNSGVIGSDISTSSNIPVPVAKLTGGLEGLTVKQISAGYSHTCAIASDDNVYCWGYGTYGELGNGSNSTSDVPVPVLRLPGGLEGLTVEKISSEGTTCTIVSSKDVYCWGSGNSGELGNGHNENSNIPVKVINPTP
ncbi:hypothetical protein LJC64_02185, partial [Ruminococcaceae bacterium OttesenSCG-928-A11]|nr:hypothetical protein [Ruminococcaceae bacterium OttesenSCG-928-A11]